MGLMRLLDEKIAQEKLSNEKIGDLFEKVCHYYLKYDPEIRNQFSLKNIAYYDDWAEENNQDIDTDLGIDLVLTTLNDDYIAVQCKYWKEKSIINYKDLATTFSMMSSNKSFRQLLIFVRSLQQLGSNLKKFIHNTQQQGHYFIKVYDLESLDNTELDWINILKNNFAPPSSCSGSREQDTRIVLRDYQKTAVAKVIAGLQKHPQGQLIMACGTGKTTTAAAIIANRKQFLTKDHQLIVFVTPFLSLVDQGYREFTRSLYQLHPLYFAVCSKADTNSEDEYYFSNILLLRKNQQIISKINEFYQKRLIIIFTTYQSLHKIYETQQASGWQIDLVICDEAHRTTGIKQEDEIRALEKTFKLILDHSKIQATKRLYMTATPKIIEFKVKNIQHGATQTIPVIYSMSNEATYGPEFFKYSFRQACQEKQLVPYQLIILSQQEGEINFFLDKIKQKCNISNDKWASYWTKLLGLFKIPVDQQTQQHMISKIICFNRYTGRKHKKKERLYESTLSPGSCWNQEWAKDISSFVKGESTLKKYHRTEWAWKHIDAQTPQNKRKKILKWIAQYTPNTIAPEQPQIKIITNAAILNTGVDIPDLDAVYFLDPKKSTIEIIQAVGRVMRKPKNKNIKKTTGYIIVPLVYTARDLKKKFQYTHEDNPKLWRQEQGRWQSIGRVINALVGFDEELADQLCRFKIDANYEQPKNGGGPITDDPPIDKVKPKITIISDPKQQQLFPTVQKYIKSIILKAGPRVGSQAENLKTISKDCLRIFKKEILKRNIHQKYQTELSNLKKNIEHYWEHKISKEKVTLLLMQYLISEPCFNALFAKQAWWMTDPVHLLLAKIAEKCTIFFQKKMKYHSVWKNYCYALRQQAKKVIQQKQSQEQFLTNFFNDFWTTAFPEEKMKSGIVFTPVEVVQFLIKSSDFLLKKVGYPQGLQDPEIKVLDPCMGSGTILQELTQFGSGQKYFQRLFGIEIQPITYFWARARLHHALDQQSQEQLLWADTLKISPQKKQPSMDPIWDDLLQQRKTFTKSIQKVNVIITNPPYRQRSNQAGDTLKEIYSEVADQKNDEKWWGIQQHFGSVGQSINFSLFFLTWMINLTQQVKPPVVISLITSNTMLHQKNQKILIGLQKLFQEIYLFDLRGNRRDKMFQGVAEEGENVFGDQSGTGVMIVFLVKKTNQQVHCKNIQHLDINDLIQKEQVTDSTADKRKLLAKHHLATLQQDFRPLKQLNDKFYPSHTAWLPSEEYYYKLTEIFNISCNGVKTGNNKLYLGFNPDTVKKNVLSVIKYYQQLLYNHSNIDQINQKTLTKALGGQVILKQLTEHKSIPNYDHSQLKVITKTPFLQKYMYCDLFFVNNAANIFTSNQTNIFLAFPYKSFSNNFTSFAFASQHHEPDQFIWEEMLFRYVNLYPLFQVNKRNAPSNTILRSTNLNPAFLKQMQYPGQSKVTPEQCLCYLYALSWHPKYRQQLQPFLHKNSPVFPKVKDEQLFLKMSMIGKKLIKLHTRTNITLAILKNMPSYGANLNLPQKHYQINKKIIVDIENHKIIYNKHITLTNIPQGAGFLKFDGVTAIKLFASELKSTNNHYNIQDHPNEAPYVQKNPQYYLWALLNIIDISCQTKKITEKMPAIDFANKLNFCKRNS